MATRELEKTKAAIAGSNLTELLELAAVLKARLEALGVPREEYSEVVFGPAPQSGAPETWAQIDRELAAHDAGEKGFSLEEMRRLAS
jgi:hypothetical protein